VSSTPNDTGLTDEDKQRIRDAVESDQNMAQALADDGRLSARPDKDMSVVDAEECALIRCMRGLGCSTDEIRAETGRARHTTRIHGTDRCSHDVAVPPTVYKQGQAVVGAPTPIDWHETRKRRREWRDER